MCHRCEHSNQRIFHQMKAGIFVFLTLQEGNSDNQVGEKQAPVGKADTKTVMKSAGYVATLKPGDQHDQERNTERVFTSKKSGLERGQDNPRSSFLNEQPKRQENEDSDCNAFKPAVEPGQGLGVKGMNEKKKRRSNAHGPIIQQPGHTEHQEPGTHGVQDNVDNNSAQRVVSKNTVFNRAA